MRIDVEFADLKKSLFLAGTNFGEKLDPSKKTDMKLTFDDERNRLVVQYKGKVAYISDGGWFSLTLANPTDAGVEMSLNEVVRSQRKVVTHKSHPTKLNIDAQVWEPGKGPSRQGE